MSMSEKLNHVVARHDELRQILATQNNMNSQELQRISKEFSGLVDIVGIVSEFRKMETEAQDLAELIADPETDNEMRTLAEEEFYELKNKLPRKENEIQLKLLPKDEADEKNAILEVRAGTGGDEAALFAGNLFRMYQRYAEQQNWKFIPIDMNETGIGGYKEASANITGKGVFARLKFESGVHRVQRVPETESQGRVHTSAATVAVLPEAEEVDIQIDTKDLRIDTYRAQGAGGQHVNKTSSKVEVRFNIMTSEGLQDSEKERLLSKLSSRLTSEGVLTMQCGESRSQHRNKAIVIERLLDLLKEQLTVNKKRKKTKPSKPDRQQNSKGCQEPQDDPNKAPK
ncbi:MAG TPA: aminoacyl-tRNA hydrolase [Rhodospirillales bacterium]|nr:aminoacyl-tRNA hydrolase [Rhodospirillales bacterium]